MKFYEDGTRVLLARLVIALIGITLSLWAFMWAIGCTRESACLSSDSGSRRFATFLLLLIFGTSVSCAFVPPYFWSLPSKPPPTRMDKVFLLIGMAMLASAAFLYLFDPNFN
jgi:hypothetical protein